jgi:cell fate regulator YaaT (PSP1 superfamily)
METHKSIDIKLNQVEAGHLADAIEHYFELRQEKRIGELSPRMILVCNILNDLRAVSPKMMNDKGMHGSTTSEAVQLS